MAKRFAAIGVGDMNLDHRDFDGLQRVVDRDGGVRVGTGVQDDTGSGLDLDMRLESAPKVMLDIICGDISNRFPEDSLHVPKCNSSQPACVETHTFRTIFCMIYLVSCEFRLELPSIRSLISKRSDVN